jgi:glycine/D-amino acid oxidase-like deaminating enzyme
MKKKHIDIAIVGGGIAGFSAAMAAAKCNKRIMLIDQAPAFGGASVNANVGTICGAFYRSFISMKMAGNAFSKYFLDELSNAPGISKPVLHEQGLFIIPYGVESVGAGWLKAPL